MKRETEDSAVVMAGNDAAAPVRQVECRRAVAGAACLADRGKQVRIGRARERLAVA